MKKYLLFLSTVAMLLTGCSKEQVVEQNGGDMSSVSFTASLATEGTKAAVDGDGAAASVNRCIMEIYYGDELFTRMYSAVDSQKKANFVTQLVSNRKYTEI